MKRLAAALLLALALRAAASAAPRAVWVWEPESYAMLKSGREAGKAIKLLEEKKITTVYLYADAYKGSNLITAKPKLYRKLIRRLRNHGIQTYALLGSWHLSTQEYVLPERRGEALAMFRRVLDYNAKAEPEARFGGVNLDIEPHMLDAWKDGKDGLMLNFLDLGRELMSLKEKAGADLKVGPAIPFWLDRMELEWNGVSKPVSEHVLDIYDYAALMDYRNRAEGTDGMIVHAASELDYASAHGKGLVVGVEVTPNELGKVTFSGLSEAAMESELALAEAEFSRKPAFSGFVIHHFESYLEWLKRQGEKAVEK
ncbi:MAG: hypothetical protein A2X35_00455 [Elusimicrobia bacterium GWA2_61_42]|nr:MAG: hypothetical protein A2X35_00455 [Elusimicrobia bacterium GWA2_61_42]OGR79198.1 MAG: hypothetical protein A2X38_06570 [Elusimicrobia bacterium GWC2_61_25]